MLEGEYSDQVTLAVIGELSSRVQRKGGMVEPSVGGAELSTSMVRSCITDGGGAVRI